MVALGTLISLAGKPRTRLTPDFALCYVLSIEHTTGLPIRTYIALYPICPLPYLRTAYTPIPARDSTALGQNSLYSN
jgi:hypothetical protein